MIYTGTVNAIRLTHGTHQAEVREGEDLCMPKLTCHPLWTVQLDEDVEH
jgi:hypothetical protein